MTQRGQRLRRTVASMRHTARALVALAVLAPVLLSISAAAHAAMPAITRTRTVKPRHEPSQPAAFVSSRKPAKAAPRREHSVSRASAAPSALRYTAAARHKPQPQRAFQQPARAAFANSRRSHRDAQIAAAPGTPAQLRRTGQPRHRHDDSSPALARFNAPPAAQAAEALPAGVPASGVAGGELSMDDFLRVAGASTEGLPMAAAANTHSAPTVQRVDGFGAEGAVLSQPRPSTAPTDAAPDVVVNAAAGDPRVRALVHPSHEEMAEELSTPMVLPGLYRNGRLLVPPPMKGSRDILVHQNTMADDEGLERVRNEDDLQRLRATRQLVDFQQSASLRLNPELAPNHRCARVWTVSFAETTARAFYARFHEPLQINSAVRTVAYQVRLQRVNGNAAGISGETSSPHLTGQAIDFGKRGMSVEQIAWMRAYLGPLMDAGKVDVEEEFQQACFHISVYRSYLPQVPALRRMQVATVVRPTAGNQ